MARRVVTALSTFVVALLLVFAVPAAQLRTITVTKSCCCPDPAHCHCPDHHGSKSSQSELKACHQSSNAIVAPTLPAFAVPETAVAIARSVTPVSIHPWLLDPHRAPAPARPDAPS